MLQDIIAERKKKLGHLRAAGVDPYPATAKRTMTAAAARRMFPALRILRKEITLAGRIMGLRDQGGVLFLDIEDETGRMQAVLNKKSLKNFKLLQETLDVGDFVSVGGTLFKTKKGEQSVKARAAEVLVKALRPLPGAHFGLEETETRLRKRYLDLILNPGVREMFRQKAVFWESIRKFLKDEGFLEVEMSALEALPGGADAEPFVTHHNALGTDFYLRISLELPLKKLLVGGFEKVFEIGRLFRNEGIDKEHLQDYMDMEFYWAYHDYRDLMRFTEKMYKAVIEKTCGTLTTKWNSYEIDWGRPWPRVDYAEIFEKNNGLNPVSASREELLRKAESLGLAADNKTGKGRLIDMIYKKTVRPNLIQPCLLINHPVDISPLAKRLLGEPGKVERVQVLACGTELGNGWSELNDPADQRERFEEQMRLRAAGDKEAQFLDEDFLEALEYGMPPAAGWGMSERLFAVLMDKPIRETVFFPLMRRES